MIYIRQTWGTIFTYPFFGLHCMSSVTQWGFRPMSLAAWGMMLFIIAQGLLLLQIDSLTIPLFLLFGFLGTSCILPYAVFSQYFPSQLAGRANTGLNVLVFIAAFGAQWAIGFIIGLWPLTGSGGYSPAGYRAGFGLIFLIQLITAGWYFFSKVDFEKTGDIISD